MFAALLPTHNALADTVLIDNKFQPVLMDAVEAIKFIRVSILGSGVLGIICWAVVSILLLAVFPIGIYTIKHCSIEINRSFLAESKLLVIGGVSAIMAGIIGLSVGCVMAYTNASYLAQSILDRSIASTFIEMNLINGLTIFAISVIVFIAYLIFYIFAYLEYHKHINNQL